MLPWVQSKYKKREQDMIKVTCLGAAGSVTGSNYLIENSLGKKVLVDCGLFQGGKQMELRNWQDWGGIAQLARLGV